MIGVKTKPLKSVAVIGAHCDDVAIGAGATLLQIALQHPGAVVHALVLTGGGTIGEIEEKNALVAMCPSLDVRLTVADLPDGGLPQHRDRVKGLIAQFRQTCEPELVFAPQHDDCHQDHRLVAELVPMEFRDHLVLSYEILKWESDLPTPTLYLPIPAEVALRKVKLLQDCYPSQAGHDWFDDEAFLGLMRIRGVQCRSRYAEGFVAEKAVFDFDNFYSPR